MTSSLPFPNDGVRYRWYEPHPYIGALCMDEDTCCTVCSAQSPVDHLYPGPHAFRPYFTYGWRVCVHCGEQRVNTQHPDEQIKQCGAVGRINDAMGTAFVYITCTLDTERYLNHFQHSASLTIYGDGGFAEGNHVSWRDKDWTHKENA